MGIREYLREHPDKGLNIHDFTIEQEKPRQELVFDPEQDILNSSWQGMKKQLEALHQNNDWRHFSWQAMRMKILFPEKANELNLDNLAWQGMKEQLEAFRQNNDWGNFSWQAMAMTILAAHKVEITDEGFEITMRPPEQDFLEPIPPRPVRRRY